MNSPDFAANAELVDAWRAFEAEESARVAVITGAGETFCAGADLKTYTMNFAQRSGHEFRVQFTDGPGFGGITRGVEISKPTIAAVNGFAISGGLELALACDLRFCFGNAEFELQDVRWGFHACDVGLVRLPQIVGLGNAMEIEMLASRAPLAQRFAKDVMKRAVGLPIGEALRLESRSFHGLGHTRDPAEGTTSFREKRPPRFSGHQAARKTRQ